MANKHLKDLVSKKSEEGAAHEKAESAAKEKKEDSKGGPGKKCKSCGGNKGYCKSCGGKGGPGSLAPMIEQLKAMNPSDVDQAELAQLVSAIMELAQKAQSQGAPSSAGAPPAMGVPQPPPGGPGAGAMPPGIVM